MDPLKLGKSGFAMTVASASVAYPIAGAGVGVAAGPARLHWTLLTTCPLHSVRPVTTSSRMLKTHCFPTLSRTVTLSSITVILLVINKNHTVSDLQSTNFTSMPLYNQVIVNQFLYLLPQ